MCIRDRTIYEQDLDLVLWLTEIIVRHRPQDDCIRQGKMCIRDRRTNMRSILQAMLKLSDDGTLMGCMEKYYFYVQRYFPEMCIRDRCC